MPTRKRSDKGEVTWEDPPRHGARSHEYDHHALAAKLRAKPNEWARIMKYATAPISASMAGTVRNARTQAWAPAGAYEAKARTVDGVHWVYARYVGAKDE